MKSRRIIVTLLVTALLLCQVFPASVMGAASYETVTNGSFEDEDISSCFDANGTTYTREVDDENNHYIKMTRAATANYWSCFRPKSAILLEKVKEYGSGLYRYTCKYKSGSGTYELNPRIIVNDKNNNAILNTNNQCKVTVSEDGWTDFTFDVEIPDWSETGIGNVVISQYTPIDNTKDYVLLIDDMSFARVPETLSVLSASPVSDSKNVEPGSKVTVNFSASLDETTLDAIQVKADGKDIPATFDVNEGELTINFAMEYETHYSIIIPTSVKGTNGAELESEYTYTFTTKSDGILETVTNGSFEDEDISKSFDANGTTYTREADDESNHYIKMTRAGAAGYWSSFRPKPSAVSDKVKEYGEGTYRYTCKYKSGSGTYELNPRVIVNDKDGKAIVNTGGLGKVTVTEGVWTTFRLDVTIPDWTNRGMSSVIISQYTPDDNTKDYVLLIDDMSFVKIADMPEQNMSVTGTTVKNNSSGVAKDTDVVISFSEDIDAETLDAITVKSGETVVSSFCSVSGGDVTVGFDKNYGKTYTVTVSDGLKSVSGNSLENDYTLTFTVTEKPDDDAPSFDLPIEAITNGDFEDEDVDSYFDKQSTIYTRLCDIDGNHYIQVIKPAGVNYWESFRPAPGKLAKKVAEYGKGAYRYSCRYKALDADFTITPTFTVMSGSDTLFTQRANISLFDGEWVYYETELDLSNLASDPTVMYIGQYLPNTSTNSEYKYCIDDISLEKVEGLKVRNILPESGSWNSQPVNGAKFEIEFSNKIKESTFQNIKLKRSGNEILCSVEKKDDYTYVLSASEELEKGTEYSISFEDGLEDTYGNKISATEYSFKTVAPEFYISDIKLSANSGTLKAGDEINAVIEYTNLTDNPQEFIVLLCTYVDGKYDAFLAISKEASANVQDGKITLSHTVTKDNTVCKVMAWDSLAGMTPLYNSLGN